MTDPSAIPRVSWALALIAGIVLRMMAEPDSVPTPAAGATNPPAPPPTPATTWTAVPPPASLGDVQKIWRNHTKIDQEFTVTSTWVAQEHWLPKFEYASPSGEHDSKQVQEVGAVEPFPSQHLVHRIAKCCRGGGHFADVGSHFGWYAALAAGMGCAVDAFEPVPWFAALLEYNLGAGNDFKSTRRIHKGVVVGKTAGERHTVRVPLTGLLGATGVKTDRSEAGAGFVDLKVTATTLDALDMLRPGQAACGLKIDVEGFEPMVLEGAVGYITQHRPVTVVLEMSPAHAPGALGSTWRDQWLAVLHRFESIGYKIYLMQWDLIKDNIESALQKSLREWVEGNNPTTPDKLFEPCRGVCILVLDLQEA